MLSLGEYSVHTTAMSADRDRSLGLARVHVDGDTKEDVLELLSRSQIASRSIWIACASDS